MMMKIVAMLLMMTCAIGCSYYDLGYSETRLNENGQPITQRTEITKLVPPGGKDISEGSITMGIDESGAWTFDMGQKSETDMEGTALMLQAMVGQYAQLAAENQKLLQQNKQLLQYVQQHQAQQ